MPTSGEESVCNGRVSVGNEIPVWCISPGTVFLNPCDILSWAECLVTEQLCGAVKAD